MAKKIPLGLRLLIFILLALLLIISRRPDQFFHPYIWAEEAGVFLPHYLKYGLLSIFIPVMGYLIVSSKIIFALSILTSFYYYPEISYVLTLLFTLSVIAAVALSPTYLRWPWVCALLTLLIPTDPEVFGVGLYTFWWTGLLLILALIWNVEGRKTGLRITYIIFAGLSSPIIVGLAPLFWARVILFRKTLARKKTEMLIAGLISLIASIQLGLLYFTNPFKSNVFNEKDFIFLFIEKFFGYFLAHSTGSQILIILAGIIILALLFYTFTIALKTKDYSLILLIISLFLLSLMSGIRVHPKWLHPVLAGPRYFFYPYVIMTWILVWIAAKQLNIMRFLIIGLIGIAVVNGTPYWARFHDKLDWRDYVAACFENRAPGQGSFNIPFHFVGSKDNVGLVTVHHNDCRYLVRKSFFNGIFNK